MRLFISNCGHRPMSGIYDGLVRQSEKSIPDGTQQLLKIPTWQIRPSNSSPEKRISAEEHALIGRIQR